jgi:3-methylfumaryl-CoA hydratase
MFAGSEVRTKTPLVLGGTAMRSAKASRPVEKSGRSGPLAFVTVDLDIATDDGGRVVERQQIVYRPAQPTSEARESAAVPNWPWRFELDADERLLFRFSALTYNAHRIHYDKPFASAIEGYPGLVVQGPLLAIGLAEVIRRNAPDRRIARFEFRAVQAAFAPTRITFLGDLDGDLVKLVAVDESGVTLMTANATIS